MKIGFICPNVPGHLNPLTALGRHLQARGHEVVFLYSTGAAGLPFIPGPEKDPLRENLPEVSKLQGDEAVKFSLRVLMTQTETILKSLPGMVESNEIDALVLDTVRTFAAEGDCGSQRSCCRRRPGRTVPGKKKVLKEIYGPGWRVRD